MDYIVPSPNASPLPPPSPNLFSHYDIPPPSPPPSGPLPKIPPPGTPSRTRALELPNGNGSSTPRSRSRTPEPGLYSQAIPLIQRGREAPFPARPLLPQTTNTNVGPGLEANIKVPRYRELYGLPLPKDSADQAAERREMDRARDWTKERDFGATNRASDWSWDPAAAYGGGEDDKDEEEENMKHVLDRFEDSRIDSEMDALQNALNSSSALEHSGSFDAIKKRIDSRYHGAESDSDYHGEGDDGEAARKSSIEDNVETNSRWSGSIYSRASLLDPEQSEEARQRFIKRVQDMYGDVGREKTIPPVPKIPEAFTTIDGPIRNWTRF
ncbi:hypothetical protein H0H93_015661 [Arthromyces matolae]|nr:hypothetical protein H0H93_015661 [Arthromyces matolae]